MFFFCNKLILACKLYGIIAVRFFFSFFQLSYFSACFTSLIIAAAKRSGLLLCNLENFYQMICYAIPFLALCIDGRLAVQ
jgi:hypothetical protein